MADIQRVVGQLAGEFRLRRFESGAEEGVAVCGHHNLMRLEVEGQHADMLFGDWCSVDDGIADILLFLHDAHHLGQYLLACGVVGQELLTLPAVSDDVGATSCQLGFVGFGILKELPAHHAETVADHPYLAASPAEDDG